MEWNELHQARLAVIAELVSRVPSGYMGRTMLMKLCYFLQELRRVPLFYNFTLYSYGPFDADVLSDLAIAVNLEAVKSTVVYNNVGYGYRLDEAQNARELKTEGSNFLATHAESLNWVVGEFGQKTAAELELESTIVFADREAYRKKEPISFDLLIDRVCTLKPHFNRDFVKTRALDLSNKKLIHTASPESALHPLLTAQ